MCPLQAGSLWIWKKFNYWTTDNLSQQNANGLRWLNAHSFINVPFNLKTCCLKNNNKKLFWCFILLCFILCYLKRILWWSLLYQIRMKNTKTTLQTCQTICYLSWIDKVEIVPLLENKNYPFDKKCYTFLSYAFLNRTLFSTLAKCRRPYI